VEFGGDKQAGKNNSAGSALPPERGRKKVTVICGANQAGNPHWIALAWVAGEEAYFSGYS
jgi:hypothetical protein